MRATMIVLVLWFAAAYGYIQNYGARDALVEEIFHRYHKSARPHDENSDITHVNMSLTLRKLIEHHEDVMTLDIWPHLEWHDHRLMWNPECYDNLDHIIVPVDKVWKPDIHVLNSAVSHENVIDDHHDVYIGHDGKVIEIIDERLSVHCEENTMHHNFHCSVIFASWTEGADGISLTPLRSEVDMDLVSPNPKISVAATCVSVETRKYQVFPSPVKEVIYKFTLTAEDIEEEHDVDEHTTPHDDGHHGDEHHETTTHAEVHVEHHDETHKADEHAAHPRDFRRH